MGTRKMVSLLGVQGGLQRGGGREQMCEAGRKPIACMFGDLSIMSKIVSAGQRLDLGH